MKIAVVLAVVLALAGTVVAQQAKITLNNSPDGKWSWELLSAKGKSLLKSEPFDDKKACARSAVALLANGGDKDRCKQGVGVVNANGVTVGETRGEEDVESEKQHIRIAAAKKIDCGDVKDAIKSIVKDFVKTHAHGEPIGNTKLKIEVNKSDKDQQFFFHIKAGNNEIVLRSEQYKKEGSATDGLVSVLLNGGVKSAYEVKPSKDGKFVFNLKALNHQIVGASETYENEGNAQQGRAGVQKKVRAILLAIVDSQAPEQQQQQKKEQGGKTEQQKKKEQQQHKKKEQQNKKKEQPQVQVQQDLPTNNNVQQQGQGQVVPAQVQPTGQQVQGQGQVVQPQGQTTGQQVQAQAAARDDHDVAEDDSDDDVEDDDDDSDF